MLAYNINDLRSDDSILDRWGGRDKVAYPEALLEYERRIWYLRPAMDSVGFVDAFDKAYRIFKNVIYKYGIPFAEAA